MRSFVATIGVAVFLFGCGSATDTELAAECGLPVESGDLETFFSDGGYLQWSAESAVHDSTGPHFGNVRTFVNDVLFDSLSATNSSHPQCSATVKELFGSGNTVLGYSYWLKLDEDSDDGEGIYWYERYNSSTLAEGRGVSVCTGCHSAGIDYFRAPFPLQ